ncbi:ATP-binding protein [Breznakiella homolactica]|uniref:Tetratricopeptide repeat protein n=1 Tax=Breznakiella homolactica TaxID=2798577 RepID=A0A7T7XPB2_9SPIR|nr:ATP-binding protein [Breznakiella homolactica]QQO09957.1 hypothetical protein JFL75_03320 [Breznakiella homolactica]
MLIDTLIDTISGGVFEKIKDKAFSLRKKAQIRKKIESAVERFSREKTVSLTRSEEIDAEGLHDFIRKELFSSIISYFYIPEQEKRKRIKKHILQNAYFSAKAASPESKRIVYQYMAMVFDILKSSLFDEDMDFLKENLLVEEIKGIIKTTVSSLENRITFLEGRVRYSGSFAEMVDSIEPKKANAIEFHYLNPIFGFYGRERETAFLSDFLDDPREILFTAVTGPGGAGKSKLVHSFVTANEYRPDWEMVYLSTGHIRNLSRFTQWDYDRGLLLIADYAGSVSGPLGIWYEMICSCSSRPPKLRLLLLDRQGIKIQNEEIIYPQWLQDFFGTGERAIKIKETFFTSNEGSGIELTSLSRDDYYFLIGDYAKDKNRMLSEEEKDTIVSYAEETAMNSHLSYPLTVLFVTSAYLEEGNFHKSTLIELLQNIIERNRKNWKETLSGNDGELYKNLELLIVFATAAGSVSVSETKLPGPFRLAQDYICARGRDTVNTIAMGLYSRIPENSTFYPLEPDLVGEVFVLDFFRNHFSDYRNQIIQSLWTAGGSFQDFLYRCILDYYGAPQYKELFKNGLELFIPENENNIEQFSILLTTIMFEGTPEDWEAAKERFEKLLSRYPQNEEMQLAYARGSFNFTASPDTEAAVGVAARLEELAAANPGNEELRLLYANGLVNLSGNQDTESAAGTVARLEKFAARYPGHSAIQLAYVRSLFNLLNKQNPESIKNTVARMEAAAVKNPGNEEIQFEFAKGLVNLSFAEETAAAVNAVMKLEVLAAAYPGNKEIVEAFARGLLTIVSKQGSDAAMQTTAQLETLAAAHPENSKLQHLYANALFYLTVGRGLDKAIIAVSHLEKIASANSENQKVQHDYAKALFNLSQQQDEDPAAETVAQLEKLALRNPGNGEIQFEYAKSLFFLAYRQNAEKAADTIPRLTAAAEANPQNQANQATYAQILRKLAAEQPLEQMAETIKKLTALVINYPENPEIRAEFAHGLVLFSWKQPLEDAEETVKMLGILAAADPENEKLLLRYIQGLVDLVNIQPMEQGEKTIEFVESLAANVPGNQEIQFAYAYGLFRLLSKQQPDPAADTMARLSAVAAANPTNREIQFEYAKGLLYLSVGHEKGDLTAAIAAAEAAAAANPGNSEAQSYYMYGLAFLLSKQDLSASAETINLMEAAAAANPDNQDIQTAYARGLEFLLGKQSGEDAAGTALRLEKLAAANPGNEEIQKIYRKACGPSSS